MALYFITNTPNKLLVDLKKAIDDGRIATWSYDKDGDFTHKTDQWKNKAWLRPEIRTDRLAFFILKPQNTSLTSETYAIYHGRFMESMLAHFDNLFSNGIASALPTDKDRVS
jgi:hypothetical protein